MYRSLVRIGTMSIVIGSCMFSTPYAAGTGASYPTRPIRLIVSNATGSSPDILARLLAALRSGLPAALQIKSVRRGGVLAPAVREMYQRQAILYAWMLARAEAAAKAITTAVKVDVLTMQALYGKAHTH